MKNHFLIIVLGAVVLSIFSLSFTYKTGYFKTSVVISETETTYHMAAKYDENKKDKAIHYIDQCLKPDLIFKDKEHLDEKIVLKDKTTFYFQFSPGEMKMKFVKSENSNASLMKIKKMCAGLNGVLNR
jgi:hypothetical protein